MQKRKLIIAIIVLISAVAASFAGIGLYAKYTDSVTLSGKVTFSANLAEGFALYEHKANPLPSGEYALSDTETVQANNYILMPGVDIPKDPQIKVTEKSSVDAYLYVEIVSGAVPDTVSYNVADCWKKLTGITGPNGGSVYAYSRNGVDPTVINGENFGNEPVYILEADGNGNTVFVSEHFSENTSFVLNLDFYAYMVQTVNTETAADAFDRSF